MKHGCIVFSLFVLLVCAVGCSQQQRDEEHELPAANPDIRGVITQVNGTPDDLRILVEEDPADSTTTAKASIHIRAGAQVLERSGTTVRGIDVAELKDSVRVSVWYDGPVLLSYPARAGAKTVVVEK